jgi:hypothetical protein
LKKEIEEWLPQSGIDIGTLKLSRTRLEAALLYPWSRTKLE